MGNALGGTVFIVGGIVLGYLVLTGRMQNILTGTPTNTNSNTTSAAPPNTAPKPVTGGALQGVNLVPPVGGAFGSPPPTVGGSFFNDTASPYGSLYAR